MHIELEVQPRPYCDPDFRLLHVGNDLSLLADLQRPEYLTVRCPDSRTAILFLKADLPYHLLLFESKLHGASGAELAKLARTLLHRRELPILIVSPSKRAGALRVQEDDAGLRKSALTKDVKALPQTIKRLLDSHMGKSPKANYLWLSSASCSDLHCCCSF